MKTNTNKLDKLNVIVFIILLSVLSVIVINDFVNARSNLNCWEKAAAANYEFTCQSPSKI